MSTDSICFKLTNYDVVALDFDNTLVQYNLDNLFKLHYNYLTTYLIDKKGYQGLETTMTHSDIDFVRKGLFLDFNRGNILNVSANGTILKASHGTKKLTVEDIIDIYGLEKKWSPIDLFIRNKIISVNNEHTYSFLDFTDCTAVVVYAKAIDLVDKLNTTVYKPVWDHVIEAIIDMYKLDSEFIATAGKDLPKYVYKCDSQILQWLREVGENCKLMLITSATPQTLNFLANYCLGSDWKNLFHTIIDLAKKPHFFYNKNCFKDLSDKEIELKRSQGYYRNGNWRDLRDIVSEEIGRPAKSIYIGDNIIQDVYAPSSAKDAALDTVSVMEESLAEGLFTGTHPHAEYIRSNFWGSYFAVDGESTLMGDIVTKHSKMCVPLVRHLAEKPLDFQHVPFWLSHHYQDNNTINCNN